MAKPEPRPFVWRDAYFAATVLLLGCGLAAKARATERATSFYVLGSGGPGAALLPPVAGIFFDNTALYYRGRAAADRQFLFGGNLVAGVEATMLADFTTLLWVPSTRIAGGTFALGGTLVVGHPEVHAKAILTGGGGASAGQSRSDTALVVGDPVATAELSWPVARNTSVAGIATVNIPVGDYRPSELANLAFHRWASDVSTAITWLSPEAGWDVSGKAGLTFNGENRATEYKTGTEFHLEGSVERKFSKSFSAGVQAYHFQQVSGDSGAGAILGPFKGRVSGLGVTAAYNFQSGKTPFTFRGRLLKEFGEQNRLGSGTSVIVSLSAPLKMQPPR